jgi:hypothetical protein
MASLYIVFFQERMCKKCTTYICFILPEITFFQHSQIKQTSYTKMYSKIPLLQHPQDWTGARLSDGTYIDLRSCRQLFLLTLMLGLACMTYQ